MSDFEVFMVHVINILAKITMMILVCAAILAFIFLPVFRLKWCALYVFVFAIAFGLERWSYNNFPYYEKAPLDD